MGKNTDSREARERLTNAAALLFYRQGYASTGINQILSESNTYKKTFYTHFESKTDLGLDYVRSRRRGALLLYLGLMRKYPRYADFIAGWMKLVRRQVRAQIYRGCPFANVANQTHPQREEFQPDVARSIRMWRRLLARYVRGLGDTEPQRTAERMIVIFEGGVQVYVMTGEERYIEFTEKELLRLDPQR